MLRLTAKELYVLDRLLKTIEGQLKTAKAFYKEIVFKSQDAQTTKKYVDIFESLKLLSSLENHITFNIKEGERLLYGFGLIKDYEAYIPFQVRKEFTISDTETFINVFGEDEYAECFDVGLLNKEMMIKALGLNKKDGYSAIIEKLPQVLQDNVEIKDSSYIAFRRNALKDADIYQIAKSNTLLSELYQIVDDATKKTLPLTHLLKIESRIKTYINTGKAYIFHEKSPYFDSDVMTINFIQKLELTNTKDFLREVSKNHSDAQQFLCYSQPKSSVIREKILAYGTLDVGVTNTKDVSFFSNLIQDQSSIYDFLASSQLNDYSEADNLHDFTQYIQSAKAKLI